MCGIAGIMNFDRNNEVKQADVKKMTDSIIHRGPDGEGFYINKNIGLGHRRLSIIDLSTGDQPMFNEDKSIVVIFNGEIYNYIELRNELLKLGHKFQTKSDTEVILKSYQEWGIDCQGKFNGMWAFALWDEREQQLILSRDRIGEKPLHYSVSNSSIVFGSEIKSIFASGTHRNLNLDLLEIYLSLSYIPAPYTFFKDIHKLNPGHCLIVKENQVKDYKFWDLPDIDEDEMVTNRKNIFEIYSNLFHDSVKIRMRCDVPYGAFLSGGLDSSSVVAIMSKISSFPVETFTIGFDNKDYDERKLAKVVADKFHTNHHEYIVGPDNFEISLNNITYHYDEPFGDSSAIPTGHVAKFASSQVKMVLTGDGGDELLSGYPTYQHEKFAFKYQKLPNWLRTGLPFAISLIPRFKNGSLSYKLNRAEIVSYSSNMDFQSRFLYKDLCIDMHLIKQITRNEKVYPIEDFVKDFMSNCTYKDPFYKLMYLNLKLTLPNDMLVKVDRMSMAYSLETRTPFLDHRLIEYLVNVHKHIKMHHFERKTILRKTIAQELPSLLLKAPKRGFAVPMHDWFKKDSFSESLNKMKQGLPFLNMRAIDGVIKANKSGEKNYGNFIWILYVLNKALERASNEII